MPQVKEGISLTHAYKYYKTECKDKGEKPVNSKIFREVMYTFFKLVVKKIVSGYHVQLPHRMGFLRIVRRKSKVDNMSINFKATKELGMTIYHDNRHSDGWHGAWSWKKPNFTVKHMIHYTFKPTREMQKMIVEIFKTNKYKRYTAL